MPTPKHTVRCLYNREIARDIWEFALTKPEGFAFHPGQFVLFDVPLLGNPADTQPRAFSIASAPQEKDLLFIAKMKEGGRASLWIAQALREGTDVTFVGALGLFLKNAPLETPTAFIATSTGVAPFRSFIAEHAQKPLNLDVVFGVRSEEDVFWREELQKFERNGVRVHVTLSQPSNAWTDHRGRVQETAPKAIPDLRDRSIYLCGSPAMTADLKKICMNDWAIPKEKIHAEGYI